MLSPEQLVHNLNNGDAQAFRQLYELFKDKVYNTAISYLQNEAEAEEATQDVFVTLHSSAASYKGDATVATWIYRVTVNKCLDRLRHRNRQKRAGFLNMLFSNSSNEPLHDSPSFDHPGVAVENKERAALLFKAIGRLPENQQTAFILKQVEGLSQKEIAGIMQVGEKAVESLLQRAKQNLKKLLQNYYDENKGL